MTRWFHVVFFADPAVQSALDQVIFLLNPNAKMPAHITVRGPFHSSSSAHRNVEDLSQGQISIVGVGRFPAPQKTVFLKCGSHSIEERWWKPDYGYNPHITVYDGPSMSLADKAFSVFNRYRFYATTFLGPLKVYKSHPGQQDWSLRFSIDFVALSESVGRQLDETTVRSLNPDERIDCLEPLVSHLKCVLSPADWQELA